MMSGSKGASAPFGIHDIVFELARKHYIMYPKMARSAFDPDIIIYYRRFKMAKCSNCGAVIPQGGSFCPRCGAQVTARPSSNRNRNRSRNPKAPGPETETASFPGQADPRYNDPAYTDPNAAANSAAYYNQTQPQLQNGAFANNYQTQPQVSMAAGQAAVTANPGRKLGTFFGICSFLFSIVGFFWSLHTRTTGLAIAAIVIAIALGIAALVKHGRLIAFPILAFCFAFVDILITVIMLAGGALARKQAQELAMNPPLSVTYGDINFTLPAGYAESESSDTYTIYGASKDDSAIVFCEMEGGLDNETFIAAASQFDPSVESLVGQMMTSYQAAGAVNTAVCGLPCREIVYSGILNGEPGYAAVSLTNHFDSNKMVMVMVVCSDKKKDKALNSYQEMLAGATLPQ